jgi:hypothetical protein
MRYGCKLLVYSENYECVSGAITREKKIKGGSCVEKIALVQSMNPDRKDFVRAWRDARKREAFAGRCEARKAEAICASGAKVMDCFAALAMTMDRRFAYCSKAWHGATSTAWCKQRR